MSNLRCLHDVNDTETIQLNLGFYAAMKPRDAFNVPELSSSSVPHSETKRELLRRAVYQVTHGDQSHAAIHATQIDFSAKLCGTPSNVQMISMEMSHFEFMGTNRHKVCGQLRIVQTDVD